jgi:hypothetical protein
MKSELARLIFQVADAQASVHILVHRMDSFPYYMAESLRRDYEEAKQERDRALERLDELCAKIEEKLK